MTDTDTNIAKTLQETQKINDELAQKQVVVEKNGVKIVMKGNQEVVEAAINGTNNPSLVEAIAEAIRKTQDIATEKLIEISSQS